MGTAAAKPSEPGSDQAGGLPANSSCVVIILTSVDTDGRPVSTTK